MIGYVGKSGTQLYGKFALIFLVKFVSLLFTPMPC
jgi:hypothetical protein